METEKVYGIHDFVFRMSHFIYERNRQKPKENVNLPAYCNPFSNLSYEKQK